MAVHVGVRGPGHLSRSGGLAPPIDPSTLFTGAQLGAWYDPSDLASMFQDSAGVTPAVVDNPVGKLNDKSGNGYHLTQGTSSARPVLRLASGLYYLEFDGVDDALVGAGAGLDLFNNVAAGSLFVAATVTTVVQAQPALFAWGRGATVGSRVAILPNSADLQAGGRRLDADTFAAATASATLTANTPFIASGLFDFANASVTLRKNRAQAAINAAFQTAGSTSATTSLTAGFSTSGFCAGRIYGAIALRRLLDAATLAGTENYLGLKAGA